MAIVIVPTPLRKFTGQASQVPIQSLVVADALRELATQFPDLKRHLVDTDGNINAFINIFVDREDIRSLEKEQTQFSDTAVISIVPAIAGGAFLPTQT